MKKEPDTSVDDIGRRAERMQNARNNPAPSPLSGISAFGMIGWSIAVPTVAGVFLGLWLDGVAPQNFSWTIALILGGVVLGGLISWAWMTKEGGK